MQSYLNSFLNFCHTFNLRPFLPDSVVVARNVAYLAHAGHRFGTIQNHVSSVKHFHQLRGFPLGWDQDYVFKLTLKGAKRFLDGQANRKQAITPLMLHRLASLFLFTKIKPGC